MAEKSDGTKSGKNVSVLSLSEIEDVGKTNAAHDNLSKPAPLARWFALVPVVLIAGALIAAMLGYRPEGAKPFTVTWRPQIMMQQSFAVTSPGMFTINTQPMKLGSEEVPAKVHMAYDQGKDFSVVAVRRPDSDIRPYDDVAKSLGLSGIDATQRADGGTMFQHDVTEEPTRTRAILVFRDRMMYQVMVTSSVSKFPVADAERFISSFRLLVKN
jgi:hypothetical protein